GIAGYSEGGFCAANLGLQHGSVFNEAGVLSGYFRPDLNQLISPPRRVTAFASKKQEKDNTPIELLRCRQPSVTLKLVPNGGHTMLTWRLLLPPMLQWMTKGLAQDDAYYNSAPARARRHAAELAKERRAHEHKAGTKTGKKDTKKTKKKQRPPTGTATKHKTPARA